jgi:hypothetical protein
MSKSRTQAHESTEPNCGVDHTKWAGPFSERTKYGEPTGRRYYRCRSCRRTAFADTRSDLSHAEDCEYASE